jgi:hypothetical protein
VTLEPRGGRAVLGVSLLDASGPAAGHAVELATAGASTLRVIAGDPRSVGIDVTGDGTPDIRIFDRMHAGLGAGDVQQNRVHDLLVTGSGLAADQEWGFAIRDGVPVSGFGSSTVEREGAGATLATSTIQQQASLEGNHAEYLQRLDGMLREARRTALERQLIPAAMFDAWFALGGEMIRLEPMIAAGSVAPPLRESAASHAQALYDALAAASVGHEDTLADPFGHTTTENPFTGDSTDSHTGFHGGAMRELPGHLRAGRWDAARSGYRTAVVGLDRWITERTVERYGAGSREAQQQRHAFETARLMHGMAGRQHLTRVYGSFLPDDSYIHGNREYQTIPLNLYAFKEGNTWHLQDITNPQHVFDDHLDVDASDTAEVPPRALFELMDYKLHFPRGVIRYQIPGGAGGEVTTTEAKTWADYLSYISMVLVGIGLVAAVVASGGAAAPGAIFTAANVSAAAFAGAGLVGAAGGIADMVERARHGALDPISMVIDLAQVVAGIAAAGGAITGRIVQAARTAAVTPGAEAWSGAWAGIALTADRFYVPLIATGVAADGVTLAAMTAETIAQLRQIDEGAGSDGDRTTAKLQLLAHLALMGGITFLSIRGAMPEIRAGGGNIVIDDVAGVPVARAGGVRVGSGSVDLASASADTHAAARWAAGSGHAPHAPEGFDDYYRRWLAQPQRVTFDPHGNPRAVFEGTPSPEVRAHIERMLADPGSDLARTERALAHAADARAVEDAVRSAGGGELDLQPGSSGWQANRGRVLDALTRRLGDAADAEAALARYERVRLGTGGADPMAFLAERRQLHTVLPEGQLTRIRDLYPGNEVYMSGAAASPGAAVQAGQPLEVVVVVPRGTTPEVMHAMEQRVNGLDLVLDPAFCDAHGLPRTTRPAIRARVVTDEQFFGLATADGASAASRTHRIDAPLTPELNRLEGMRGTLGDAALQGLTTRGLGADEITRLTTALGATRLEALAAEAGLTADDLRRIAGLDSATLTRLGPHLTGRVLAQLERDLGGSALDALARELDAPEIQFLLTRMTGAEAAALHGLGGRSLHTLARTLTGAEITALRTALGNDALLSQIAAAGGARLRDLVTEIGPAALRDTASRLTPARFVELANPPGAVVRLTGGQMSALSAGFSDAELTFLETMMTRHELAAFFAAPEMGAGGLRLIHRAASHPQIQGMADWVIFEARTSRHTGADWGRSRTELEEALRLAGENPGATLQVGGDANPPMRSGGRPGRRAPTFDMTMTDATGTVTRSIETTTVQGPVMRAAQLTDGVAHAGRKAVDRAANAVDIPAGAHGVVSPVPGELDAVIRIALAHGELDTATRTLTPAGGVAVGTAPPHTPGRNGVVFDGAGGYEMQNHVAYTGVTNIPPVWEGRPNPGNVFTDLLNALNGAPPINGSDLLRRVRLVGMDGNVVAEFTGTGVPGGWTRTR